MNKSLLPVFVFLSASLSAFAQVNTSPGELETLLRQRGSAKLLSILDQPERFRYQLIYTRIDRDSRNQPYFTEFTYHLDKHVYFNPASMVKMPLAFLALEKLNKMNKRGASRSTAILTDSAMPPQTRVFADSSSENGLPSIAHYIRKIFLVSDNDAYNRLYEFLGQQYINERLWKMGYADMRITRRFVRMTEEENRHTNPVRFVKDGKTLYAQPQAYSRLQFDFSRKQLIGKAHYNRDEQLIQSPMDFTTHNNAPLHDLQMILRSVLFPESVPKRNRFDLRKDDYEFLYRYMSKLPTESIHPKYDTTEFFNSYTKFFMFRADSSRIPEHIRIFNKTGWSYGFLTDVAYIVDFANQVEFMLSGVIYVNDDGVLNDDKYEYRETGYPFFKEVGNIVYEYELKRPRKYKPDLSRLKFNYEE